MPSEAQTPDTQDLERRVKEIYTEVAEEPFKEFHFETRRALAERLECPRAELDAIPADAIDSFAGVGYYFDLARIQPGETVIDLGQRLGHRQPPRRASLLVGLVVVRYDRTAAPNSSVMRRSVLHLVLCVLRTRAARRRCTPEPPP
jgi:arsenite methyltransferase